MRDQTDSCTLPLPLYLAQAKTSAQAIRIAKREHREAIKRYGRGDFVTRDYLQSLRDVAGALIAGHALA